MDWDVETDVVVVGAGGCGLVAAITAATFAGGVNVVLLEKSSRLPSNTAMATGAWPAAGTRLQRAAGIDDSPELMAEDITRKNHGQSDPELTLALCRRSAAVVHWFIDDLGIPLDLELEIKRFDHSRMRMQAHPTRSGAPIVQALREHVARLPNVVYADNTPGRELLVDERGAVVGLVAGQDGHTQRVGCRRLVLATGGFGASRAMLAQHIPDMADAAYFGAQTNTGEGIRWGLELGAAVEHMAAYQGLGSVIPGYGTRLHHGVITDGGIMVNTAGRRFEREDLGYSEWGSVVLRQPGGVAIAIWDEGMHRKVERTNDMVESLAAGAITRCETLADVARRFSLDEGTLVATVADYNRGVAAGRDAFGRQRLPQPLGSPYYAAKVTGALAHTQGGLRVDVHGRVLRADGSPVPHLYAGGGTAAGISGDSPSGYLSGNGLLSAFGLGRIIGEHVVTSLRGAA